MAGEFGPRPSPDLHIVQTEFFVHPVLAEQRRVAVRRSLVASQNRGVPTDAVGPSLHPGWTFIERQVYRFNLIGGLLRNLPIYPDSRLLDIAEQIVGADIAL
jgi:hypothetical protein